MPQEVVMSDETQATIQRFHDALNVDDRAFVRWRYGWADGHVRGVDVMRVRDGLVIETFAYVKG